MTESFKQPPPCPWKSAPTPDVQHRHATLTSPGLRAGPPRDRGQVPCCRRWSRRWCSSLLLLWETRYWPDPVVVVVVGGGGGGGDGFNRLWRVFAWIPPWDYEYSLPVWTPV